ncbi:MAG: DUF1934 domain-containing protein [Lachnospiraceae bacterium]|nr:DUF1934 domain-containing protein [Lachnospiraceae bacterium]
MTEEVSIRIKGSSSGDDTEIISEARGSYHLHKGRHYVTFDEEDTVSGTVIKNNITIDEIRMHHSKLGETETSLCFEKEKEHETQYRTPYGSFTLMTKTNSYEVITEEESIRVYIDYELILNGQSSGNRIIEMEIGGIKDNEY